ncbi:MAG: ABC transporter ATP-binding protein [Pirellulales bacterium]|nr:ABC transporter ATP-binding protein [Pirellulales bacterium]
MSPPPAKSTPAPSSWALLLRLLGLGWKYRLACLHVLAQQLLLVGLSLGQLYLAGLGIDVIRWQLDSAAQANPWPAWLEFPRAWSPLTQVAAIAGVILFAAVFHAVMRYRATIVMTRLAQMKIVFQLRTAVYDKLQRLSFRFFDANQSGSIINRVTGDVQAVRMFIDGVLIQVLTVGLSLALYLAYMLSIHVWLTLACLATTPLLWLGAVVFSRIVRPQYQQNSKLVDQIMLVLSENVQGQSVVKGFGRQAAEIEKFAAANAAVRDQKNQIFATVSWFQPLMGFLTQINMVVLLGYGGYLVVSRQLELGLGLFVFAKLLHEFANQVGQITNIANSIQASFTGAERVFEILDTPLEVQNPPAPRIPPVLLGEVQFENVNFQYLSGTPILQQVEFTARPGQCVAILGATGAGKSTLVSLIPRFYDATAGRILVDGLDVREWDLDVLRRNVGLVFQESFLFSNTVAANIAFGHPGATREQIERAAKIAAAHEFIVDLPHGYDTVIGEYGTDLSGGQRQRLAIARAVLLEPTILIMDDALAAVDPETEGEIVAAMESAMRGRTTFVIAHRLSTIRRADLVLVLQNGKIIQRGTPADLLETAGHYRAVAELQLSN